MDPEQELQKQVADIFRKAVEGGASEQQAARVARMYMERHSNADLAEVAQMGGGPAPPAQPDEPGGLESFGRGAAQGATLGFADEIAAGARAAGTLLPGGRPAAEFGEAFGEEVEESRARDRAAREAHQGLNFAGELAGTVVPAVAGGAAAGVLRGARGATTAARAGTSAGRLAASGAAAGGLEAAGRAEGNVAERLPQATAGAAFGGALSFGIPFVGKGLKKVGQAFGFHGRGGAQARAADEILDALDAEEMAPADLLTRATGTADETAMEVGGENVRRLAETADLYPHANRGPMREFLEERAEGQFPRVQEAIESGTGLQRQDAGGLAREIMESRKAAAQPLYDAAYERTVSREVLGDVLDDPVFQEAYQRGVRIAQREGVDLSPSGAMLPEGTGMFGGQEIPVQAIDYMKRGLDDAIESGMRSTRGMGRQEARVLRRQLNDVLESVDEAVPEYAAARAQYAGDSAMLEALEEGRSRFHLDPPEELAARLDEMTPSEIEMFRRGAVDNILHRLGNVSDRYDLMKRIVQSPNDQARMGLLFDDPEAYTTFMQRMGAMAEQGVTKDVVLGNSRTAGRQAQRTAFEGEGVGSSFSLRGILDEFGGERRVNAATEKAEAITPMLMERDLPSLVELLEGRAGARAGAAQRARIAPRYGAMSGVILSDLLSDPTRDSR